MRSNSIACRGPGALDGLSPERAYEAVGDWLNREGSSLAPYRPEVYAQGSFALGTAIRPLDDCDYDVDAVCELAIPEESMSPSEVKAMVGDRLREHAGYAAMLGPKDGGRRCWTLQYAESSSFHLDLLPAIPIDARRKVTLNVAEEYARHALGITDSESWLWQPSNPRGYALWFHERTRVRGQSDITRITAGVQALPEAVATTPLQQAVQLLKRQRDVKYGDDVHKPISIIITTLAARAYEGSESLEETLRAIIPAMRDGFELRNGVVWVPNPVRPDENFADKWAGEPEKRERFVEWLTELERETTAGTRHLAAAESYVRKAYRVDGRRQEQPHVARPTLVSVPQSLVAPQNAASSVVAVPPVQQRVVKSRFDVPHREQPPWLLSCNLRVEVFAEVLKGGRWLPFQSGAGALHTNKSLRFTARTTVAAPFDVYWQVVNTGPYAAAANGLRGEIERAAGSSEAGLERPESTLYQGHHSIECFVVKNGVCVARSGEFEVSV